VPQTSEASHPFALTFSVGDDVRSVDPLLGADDERNSPWAGARVYNHACVVSASYDRSVNGACVPVKELGSKTLG